MHSGVQSGLAGGTEEEFERLIPLPDCDEARRSDPSGAGWVPSGRRSRHFPPIRVAFALFAADWVGVRGYSGQSGRHSRFMLPILVCRLMPGSPGQETVGEAIKLSVRPIYCETLAGSASGSRRARSRSRPVALFRAEWVGIRIYSRRLSQFMRPNAPEKSMISVEAFTGYGNKTNFSGADGNATATAPCVASIARSEFVQAPPNKTKQNCLDLGGKGGRTGQNLSSPTLNSERLGNMGRVTRTSYFQLIRIGPAFVNSATTRSASIPPAAHLACSNSNNATSRNARSLQPLALLSSAR